MTKYTYTCKNGDATIYYHHTYMTGEWWISQRFDNCNLNCVVRGFKSFKEAEDWLLNHDSEHKWSKSA